MGSSQNLPKILRQGAEGGSLVSWQWSCADTKALKNNDKPDRCVNDQLRIRGPAMKKHEIVSPQARAALFDPPSDPAAIVRHYTFSPEDLALIHRRRRDANRLGFAVHLAYHRFPGRVLGIEELPSADVLSFIAGVDWHFKCWTSPLLNFNGLAET